jgi:hypothetical protein
MYDNGFIQQDLFSVLIGAKVVFKFIIPLLLAFFINRWDLEFEEAEKSDE